MMGYDISWAAFNIIEVMSSSKFTFKVTVNILIIHGHGIYPFIFERMLHVN